MWTCLCALGGASHCTKWIPVDRHFQDRSLWMERIWREGDDDEEGRWLLANGVQQGRNSLLMKSHLRPPFTLNMGHCSCPDLGFDPQRCLTPTIPQEPLSPPSGQQACICIHMCTHPQIHMHVHVGWSIYTCTYAFTPLSLDSSSAGVCSFMCRIYFLACVCIIDLCIFFFFFRYTPTRKSLPLSSLVAKEGEGKQGTHHTKCVNVVISRMDFGVSPSHHHTSLTTTFMSQDISCLPCCFTLHFSHYHPNSCHAP